MHGVDPATFHLGQVCLQRKRGQCLTEDHDLSWLRFHFREGGVTELGIRACSAQDEFGKSQRAAQVYTQRSQVFLMAVPTPASGIRRWGHSSLAHPLRLLNKPCTGSLRPLRQVEGFIFISWTALSCSGKQSHAKNENTCRPCLHDQVPEGGGA